MIVTSKKFGRQNSAYRHQIMKGASETERLSLFCKAHKNVPVENHPNSLRSACGAATFCAASPRTQAAARGDSRRSGDSRRLSARAALWHAHASNSPPQRRRLETGGSEKSAIHRTVVMIGARSAE